MFDIVLQNNQSEKNRVTKTVIDIATVSGVLKTETSIIDPVFLIQGDMNNYIGLNYITVSTFGRSYFVNNIRSIRTDLFEITCHVDVLSSFASEIKQNKAIIRRSENEWNLYLNDGSFRTYQNPHIVTREFPGGFNTHEFVLAIAGA